MPALRLRNSRIPEAQPNDSIFRANFGVWRNELALPTGELDRQEPELGYSTVLP